MLQDDQTCLKIETGKRSKVDMEAVIGPRRSATVVAVLIADLFKASSWDGTDV